MSKGGQQQQQMEFGSSGRGGRGFIQNRTIVINRGNNSAVPRSSIYNRASSGFGGLSLAPGTYQSMSHEGVVNMKGKREHEKKEMQSLNERLGGYIEKVRFLEATISQQEQELEFYRNQKSADLKPIRDMYEKELEQARRVIDDLSAEKAGYDSKFAGLQDLVDSLRQTIDTLESQAADDRQKIDNQASQIGGYEGELGTLRLRIENLENECGKLRQLNAQKGEENRRLRADVDSETAAHIEADCRATTLEEEVEFLRALLDKIPQNEKQQVKIKGLDPEVFWKDNMAKALRDINAEYENRIDLMKQDMEARYSAQIRQLQSGAVRDNMETSHAKEECKKLKSQMGDNSKRFVDLEARIAALESERNDLRKKVSELENTLDDERMKHDGEKERLRSELECCLEELKLIMDAKLSLELEIACYRQLLEGEENRLGLRQIVEQAIGAQTKGASNLSDIVQQASLSESTGKLTVSRSARGPIGFAEAAHDGSYVTIEHTGKGNSKPQDLTNWQIVRSLNNVKNPIVYNFLAGETIYPGKKLTIYAKGAASDKNIKNEANASGFRCCDEFSWKHGSGTTRLLDASGVEKAHIKAVFKE